MTLAERVRKTEEELNEIRDYLARIAGHVGMVEDDNEEEIEDECGGCGLPTSECDCPEEDDGCAKCGADYGECKCESADEPDQDDKPHVIARTLRSGAKREFLTRMNPGEGTPVWGAFKRAIVFPSCMAAERFIHDLRVVADEYPKWYPTQVIPYDDPEKFLPKSPKRRK
jgi:hypothetical protein